MAARKAYLSKLRQDAAAIFHAGLKAVNAEAAVLSACRVEGGHLHTPAGDFDLSAAGRIYVIGAGKASADMAAAIERLLGERITAGAVTVKYGHTRQLNHIRLTEAGHPVPDSNGLDGSRRILDIADTATENDLVICLISGGGSALMPLPQPPLTLSDKQQTIRALMDCGAGINEINAIRKHLSAIKGGHLAGRIFPAAGLTLIVSDVIGDNLDVIASGPTVPDTSCFSDCLQIIEAYEIRNRLPKAVFDHLAAGAAGAMEETPKADAEAFKNTRNAIVASSRTALARAKEAAVALGYNSLILSALIQGETKDAARVHAGIAMEIRQTGNPVEPPACILSGGETTVTIHGRGKGGRNQEFALAAALDIAGEPGIVILSGGTDGTDGPTDAAGAVVDSNTVQNALDAGLSPLAHLQANNAYPFFEQTGELLMTGPTGTNVMDLRIVLVDSKTEKT